MITEKTGPWSPSGAMVTTVRATGQPWQGRTVAEPFPAVRALRQVPGQRIDLGDLVRVQ